MNTILVLPILFIIGFVIFAFRQGQQTHIRYISHLKRFHNENDLKLTSTTKNREVNIITTQQEKEI